MSEELVRRTQSPSERGGLPVKLLPREPTQEMINAGIDAQDYVESYVNEIYRAMYDAAPRPTGGEGMSDDKGDWLHEVRRDKELDRRWEEMADMTLRLSAIELALKSGPMDEHELRTQMLSLVFAVRALSMSGVSVRRPTWP